jgi:hypothetical protein
MNASARPLAMIPLVLTLVLAACSGGLSSSGGQISHPGGNELVLRVEGRGGFLMADAAFTMLPTFTLLGDGRIIVPGAQIDIFPGPALPAVDVRQLTEAGVQSVLRAVAATGQFAASAEWRGAQGFVADAGDTVFTLNAEGRTVTVSVYGLGTFTAGDPPPNLPAAEVRVHQALTRLLEQLTAPDGWLPAAAWARQAPQPYVADALRLLVRNADADPPDESGIANQELAWPTEDDPATFGEPALGGDYRCGVVTDEAAAAWYATLATANQLTRFTAGDHRYQVSVRPLLPDEPAECPSQT